MKASPQSFVEEWLKLRDFVVNIGRRCWVTLLHVSFDDFDVAISVWSGVLVVKAQSVHHFVHDSSDCAQAVARFFVRRS